MTPEALIIESMFFIVNKDGEKVPFKLNVGQRILDDNFTGRDIVPKSRQQGVSRYVLARFTAACLGWRNQVCAIISHERESTERLLAHCRYYLNNLRDGVRPEIQYNSSNQITFPKTDSMLYIGTAGSKKFGRGDTIRRLHCSEYAYWENGSELFGGLRQAVPRSGEIWIESTGNGRGNDYHRRCMRAFEGNSEWFCHFLPWYIDPDCTMPLSKDEVKYVMANLRLDLEEDKLVEQHNCTAEQLVWRRGIIADLDGDMRFFNKEYPTTIADCFQIARGGIFEKVNFQYHPEWKELQPGLFGLPEHPMPNLHYVIGADPAGGTERDNSCAEVFCLDIKQQVMEYTSNKLGPDQFGNKLYEWGRHYNDAYMVVESNNHGVVTLQELRRTDYPRYLIHTTASGDLKEDPGLLKMGFRTTVRSKPIMIGNLRRVIREEWIIYSPLLSDELSTYVENPDTGKLGASPGNLDDRVMASACALMGEGRASIRTVKQGKRTVKARGRPAENKFSGDYLIKQAEKRRNGRYPGSRPTFGVQ